MAATTYCTRPVVSAVEQDYCLVSDKCATMQMSMCVLMLMLRFMCWPLKLLRRIVLPCSVEQLSASSHALGTLSYAERVHTKMCRRASLWGMCNRIVVWDRLELCLWLC